MNPVDFEAGCIFRGSASTGEDYEIWISTKAVTTREANIQKEMTPVRVGRSRRSLEFWTARVLWEEESKIEPFPNKETA